MGAATSSYGRHVAISHWSSFNLLSLQTGVSTGSITHAANLSASVVCIRAGEGYHCPGFDTFSGRFGERFTVLTNATADTCLKHIFFEAEVTWGHQTRAVLYACGLLYCFVGLATITNLYMQAMEMIVQQTRKVVRRDFDTGNEEETSERIWNPVIADITLLALGTSAPQISLAIIDAVQQLGQVTSQGLGPGTIVGSAAFNLYPILAVCVLVPKPGTVKRIQNVGVWVVELVWSFWAYIWLLIILKVSSPDVVSPWEAICTIMQFPLLMLHAYIQDKGWSKFSLPLFGLKRGLQKPASDPILPIVNSVKEIIIPPSDARQEEKKPAWELANLHYQPMPSSADETTNGHVTSGHHEFHFVLQHSTNEAAAENDRPYFLPGEANSGSGRQEDMVAMLSSESRSHRKHILTWADMFLLWKEQFCDAMTVQRQVDSSGKEILPSAMQLICHPVSFAWRVLFAFIPPPAMFQGWLAFLCALAFITGISNFLIKLANLFGCVTDIEEYAIAITVLATGTSWPDLIASKISAEHSTTADSAIANINASNCINVFVGIGIPWLLQVFYNQLRLHDEFRVPSSGLGFSLILFFGTFVLCQIAVIRRRYCFGGELGGPRKWAWASSLYFMFLWLIFVVFSCLRAYHLL